MKLEHYLILNRYFLQALGSDTLDQLKGVLQNQQEGDDGAGHSFYYAALRGMADQRRLPTVQRLSSAQLEAYDRRVMEYQGELEKHRRGIAFKYFQYLAILFTEIYLDRLTTHPDGFRTELNRFREYAQRQEAALAGFPEFTADDLRRLAFFMATGSGKTLLLHVNLWQIQYYLKHGKHPEALVQRGDRRRAFDNVLLITPYEGLSSQHLEELQRSGITAEPLTRGSRAGSLYKPAVRVIEISKLAEEATGEGVSIPLEQLGSANLVFVDEGHKGTGSEAQAWKKKQKRLSEQGMLLEYSATFAQAIAAARVGAKEELRQDYGKAILFDYSYRHFYEDGYGKDFFVMNVASDRERDAHDVLAGGVLLFYQQRRLLGAHQQSYSPYQVEMPLWVFLGTSVTAGAKGRSDVAEVVSFLRRFLGNPEWAIARIQKALDGKSGFSEEGRDLLVPRIHPLLSEFEDARALYAVITDEIFHGRGGLEITELKNAEGELGLRVSAPGDAEKPYFGVINIGDVAEFKKHLREKLDLEVQEDHFTPSLFADVNEKASPINILIGSKKFIEGWSSWRVSCMGLLNIAKSEGPQFLQLFGRGVRLKGKGWTLKRSESLPGPHPDDLEQLETLYILGWNADYMQTFRKMLDEEDIGQKLELPVEPMQPWPEHLRLPRLKREYVAGTRTWVLRADGNPVTVDCTPMVTAVTANHAAGSDQTNAPEEPLSVAQGYAGTRTLVDFNLPRYRDLLDEDALYAELAAYKAKQRYENVFIARSVLLPILQDSELYMPEADARDPGRVQEGAGSVLKAYLDRFLKACEREEQGHYLTPTPLRADDTLLRPYTLQVEANLLPKMRALLEDKRALLRDDTAQLPRLYLESHLFNPVLLDTGEHGAEGISSIPTGLVKSEEDFVVHLRSFWQRNHQHPPYNGWEIYLLRNLPRAGVGFFQRSGFYPDFLLWIEEKKTGSTRLLFVEPHGLGRQGAAGDEDKARALDKLAEISQQPEFVAAQMILEGYILTETPLTDIQHGQQLTWDELARRYHVYRQDANGSYIHTLLNGPSRS